MCIRDRACAAPSAAVAPRISGAYSASLSAYAAIHTCDGQTCLLYTSDAADERSSVDLGGSRIIKKKKIQISYKIHTTRNDTSRRATIKRHDRHK